MAAERMGISTKYLYMMERGERKMPSVKVARRVAAAYGRTVDDLDSDDPGPADTSRMPVISFRLHLSREEERMLASELVHVYDEIDDINQRLRARLASIREKL